MNRADHGSSEVANNSPASGTLQAAPPVTVTCPHQLPQHLQSSTVQSHHKSQAVAFRPFFHTCFPYRVFSFSSSQFASFLLSPAEATGAIFPRCRERIPTARSCMAPESLVPDRERARTQPSARCRHTTSSPASKAASNITKSP